MCATSTISTCCSPNSATRSINIASTTASRPRSTIRSRSYQQEGLKHLGYSAGRFPVTDRHAREVISFPVDQHLTARSRTACSTPSGSSTMDTDATTRRIGYVNLPAQFEEERTEIMQAWKACFARGFYRRRSGRASSNRNSPAYLGTPHVVTLNSGTDALVLAMEGARHRPGDEVITPPNSFVASTASIVAVGATLSSPTCCRTRISIPSRSRPP